IPWYFVPGHLFFFNDPSTPHIYTLSLHDALPISGAQSHCRCFRPGGDPRVPPAAVAVSEARPNAICPRRPQARDAQVRLPRLLRSEEHTSELQSPCNLVCRLLLEKKK